MANVTVRTKDILGVAIEGLVVTCVPKSTPFNSGTSTIHSGSKTATTDSNGEGTFSGLQAGTYQFQFADRPEDHLNKVVPNDSNSYNLTALDDADGTNSTLSTPDATYHRRDGTGGMNIGSDATGDIYYRNASGNTARLPIGQADQILKVASGLPSWEDGGEGTGDVTGPGSSTDGNLPSFSGTGGKTLQDSGIAAASVVTAASTTTLTNKTFDANGTGNALSNVETADIASGSKSGSDATLITGTAGTNGDLAAWNGDGDLVDGPTPPSGVIVGNTDTQTLTNKTFDDHVTVKEIVAPGTPATGYGALYAKTDGNLYWKDDAGTETDLTASGSGDVSGPGSSTDGNLPSFSGTGGDTLQDSGIAAADVVTGSSTDTFTNKTFDANGTGNSLSNVETADIASGSKSGSDVTLITGTAGTSGDLAIWNGDGDLVDGPTPPAGAIVGTSDTQTLSGKSFSDHITVDEIAAPSTPATGKVAVYAKTDGKLYIKDDAGTETDLTSGGGGGGKLVQRVVGEYSTYYSATGNVIPMDDTIPQNTEGGEVMTQAITPTSSSNKLQIRVYGNWFTTTTSIECAAALFQDATADALSPVYARPAFGQTFVINHNMTAGTTSSTTFKLRVGVGNAAHPVYINGNNSTRLFGAKYRVTMIIDEYET